MKKMWLAALAALVLTSSSALAADLGQPYYKAPPPPAPPPPSWTGFYIGVNGGYGWSQHTSDLFCAGGVVCTDTVGGVLQPQGGLAGGQIGYNWQSGIVVYGIEADIQWADIHDSATAFVGPGLADTFTVSDKLDWLGTVRGRLGITPWGNNALLYVTGGLIYGGEKVSASLDNAAGFFSISDSTTRTGGTVGGGIEYMFTPNFSGKIEGLWYDMGTADLFLTNGETAHNHLEGAIVRAGLNWHFNWGGYGPGGPGPQ
jgi:outer membrane immunogenic protein